MPRLKIEVDTSQAGRGLDEIERRARQMARNGIAPAHERVEALGGSFDRLKQRALSVRSAIAGVGGIATAVAGGGVAALATQSVQAASRLDQMSRAAGVNVETLQRLQAAGEDFQVRGEEVADGLRELQVRADEFANQGGGEAAEAFERINLQQADVAKNLDDNERLFRLVIQRVGELDDRASRVSLLDQIFGEEAGRQLLGFLEAGQGEIKRIGDEAERAGRILSGETTEAATKLENEFQDVADAVQKAFARGTVEAFNGEIGNVSKTITDTEFQDAITSIGTNFGEASKDAKALLGFMSNIANSGFADFVRDSAPFQGLIPDISELAEGDFSSLKDFLVNPQIREGAQSLADGSGEVERLTSRMAQLREQIDRMREAGRPIPPQFLENLQSMQERLTSLLEPADGVATAMETLTVKADPLPQLFTQSGEAGGLLSEKLFDIGDAGEGAAGGMDNAAQAAEALAAVDSGPIADYASPMSNMRAMLARFEESEQ